MSFFLSWLIISRGNVKIFFWGGCENLIFLILEGPKYEKMSIFPLKLCLILEWKSNLNSILIAYGVNEAVYLLNAHLPFSLLILHFSF